MPVPVSKEEVDIEHRIIILKRELVYSEDQLRKSKTAEDISYWQFRETIAIAQLKQQLNHWREYFRLFHELTFQQYWDEVWPY